MLDGRVPRCTFCMGVELYHFLYPLSLCVRACVRVCACMCLSLSLPVPSPSSDSLCIQAIHNSLRDGAGSHRKNFINMDILDIHNKS